MSNIFNILNQITLLKKLVRVVLAGSVVLVFTVYHL